MQQKNLITCFFFALFITACFSCNHAQKEHEETPVTAEGANTASEPAVTAQPIIADENKLIGNWVRTDAPYNLDITELLKDGNLKAEYLNPKSIHVEKANWANANGVIQIYIELRDENYPGSNYKLTYFPDNDLLSGKYFQAVEGVTYDIGFTRVK
jgi:hypothetical protein